MASFKEVAACIIITCLLLLAHLPPSAEARNLMKFTKLHFRFPIKENAFDRASVVKNLHDTVAVSTDRKLIWSVPSPGDGH